MITFLKNLRAELAHVVWPSRKETIWYTVVVVVISLITAYYLGLFDYIFAQLLTYIIS